jgi:hypothetical protein
MIPDAIVLETIAMPTMNRRTSAPTIKETFKDNFILQPLFLKNFALKRVCKK